eukprot:CAMPEP_0174844098 /NCGR_PEP_ID=MMETSP1114-20130205/10905_1 /TAXON_ID=312471 /ORGANISM="Neobodo designis, Strain CCAP 1951/1" /LENGTH=522 /DNA_ID=CAMNT_0016078331 /DNA_START=120 /DNA_END=1688 /DNA_ORIENTATION=-
MARGIRSGTPTVEGVHENLWYARGALRFNQGMQVLYNHFASKHVADVLSHPFFIEKEYWPEQPSPQFQLTEELQCLSMVVRGAFMTRDVSTHLDNTMTIIRNERNPREFALYNPISVSDATLTRVRTVIGDGEVVQIIVPTRVAWQSVGEWALQYPKAEIACSGNVPPRFTKAGAQAVEEELERWKEETGWNARKKEHEEKAEEEARVKEELAERNAKFVGRRRKMDTRTDGPLTKGGKDSSSRWDNIPTMIRAQQQASMSVASAGGMQAPAMPYLSENRLSKEDSEKRKRDFDLNRLGRADIFSNAAFADELDADTRKRVTMSDPAGAMRRDMPGMKKKKKKNPEESEMKLSPEAVEQLRQEAQELLKPDPAPADMASNVRIMDPYAGHDVFGDGKARLLHISGDRATNEFALYHEPSKTLACTDLYHGGYADHDPNNTWLCRVWFKFQRNGNFKSMTDLPAYRRIQIERHGDWIEMQSCVDDLTRAFPIERILSAHGTQPVAETPVAFLREMYDLPPLDE